MNKPLELCRTEHNWTCDWPTKHSTAFIQSFITSLNISYVMPQFENYLHASYAALSPKHLACIVLISQHTFYLQTELITNWKKIVQQNNTQIFSVPPAPWQTRLERCVAMSVYGRRVTDTFSRLRWVRTSSDNFSLSTNNLKKKFPRHTSCHKNI